MSQSRFTIVPTDAIMDTELTHTQLRVLAAIGSFTNRKQTAYPSRATIADMLGIAKETVSRCISVLNRKGYIEVTRQFRNNGSQTTNLYFVPLDRAILPDAVIGGDARITPPVTEASTLGVTAGDHPFKKKQPKEELRASALGKIFMGFIRNGAPAPDVEALSRAVVEYDSCSIKVRSPWERDRAEQTLSQWLKQAALKIEVVS
jgi:hypothetical protein